MCKAFGATNMRFNYQSDSDDAWAIFLCVKCLAEAFASLRIDEQLGRLHGGQPAPLDSGKICLCWLQSDGSDGCKDLHIGRVHLQMQTGLNNVTPPQ